MSLTSNPLRSRVHHNVGTKVDRPAEVSSSTKCVVDNDRNTSLVRNRYDLLEVGDVVPWVADTLKL